MSKYTATATVTVDAYNVENARGKVDRAIREGVAAGYILAGQQTGDPVAVVPPAAEETVTVTTAELGRMVQEAVEAALASREA